jgi:hypothetical protein
VTGREIRFRKPAVRHRRLPDMPGPVLGGMHVAAGGRASPGRDSSARPGEDFLAGLAAARVPAQRGPCVGRADPGAAPCGGGTASADTAARALADGPDDAAATLDAVGSEPFPGSAS